MTVLARFDCSDVSGASQLSDSSGNDRHATLSGGAEFTDDAILCRSVSRVGPYIALPDILNLTTDKCTIHLEAILPAIASNFRLLVFNDSNTDLAPNAFMIRYDAEGDLRIATATAGGVTANNVYTLHELMRLTVTISANTITVFKDGVEQASGAITSYPSGTHGYSYAGRSTYNDGTDGSMFVKRMCFTDTIVSGEGLTALCRVNHPDPWYYSDTVKVKGVAAVAKVMLLRDSTGEVVDETTSDAGTGEFKLYTPHNEPHTIMHWSPSVLYPHRLRSYAMPDGKVGA